MNVVLTQSVSTTANITVTTTTLWPFSRTTQMSWYKKMIICHFCIFVALGWLLEQSSATSHCMTARQLEAATQMRVREPTFHPKMLCWMPLMPQSGQFTSAWNWTKYSRAWLATLFIPLRTQTDEQMCITCLKTSNITKG